MARSRAENPEPSSFEKLFAKYEAKMFSSSSMPREKPA
jgi:hypothetical protein